MTCSCGGWRYVGVAEIGNRERAVMICVKCGDKTPVAGDTPLVTKAMVEEKRDAVA